MSEVPTTTVDHVPELVAAGWQLVDVRTPGEWAGGHVPGAVHIPMDEVLARWDEIDDPVIFVCAVGGRSARVTAYAVGQGREALNLDGGTQAWVAAGRPLDP